jgi:hypothetical protein
MGSMDRHVRRAWQFGAVFVIGLILSSHGYSTMHPDTNLQQSIWGNPANVWPTRELWAGIAIMVVALFGIAVNVARSRQ